MKHAPMGQATREMFGGWRANPSLLGFLALDQIKDRFAQFAHVGKVVDKWLYMGSRAGQLMEKPDNLKQTWAALQRREPAMTAKMEKLFIDSTLAEAWVNGDVRTEPALDKRNAHLDFKDPAVARKVAEMRTAYAALSPVHQKLYTDVLASLGDQFRGKQEAILSHVVDLFTSDLKDVASRAELLAMAQAGKPARKQMSDDVRPNLPARDRLNLQKLFAALDTTYVPRSEVPGPYFPLQRKGDHLVVRKSKAYQTLGK
jgi:hypothetical protein